jgi:hypothetical protein
MILLVEGSTTIIAEFPTSPGSGTDIVVEELAVIESLDSEVPVTSYVPTVIACEVGNVPVPAGKVSVTLLGQLLCSICPVS